MALITCPHCGKQVSDTVERCIHCGEILKKTYSKPAQKNFSALPTSERKRLEEEFLTTYSAYDYNSARNIARKTKKIAFVSRIVLWVALAVLISLVCIFFNSKNTTILGILSLILLIVLISSLVTWIVCVVISHKEHKMYLIYLRVFQEWLLKAKNIVWQVMFSETQYRDKRYFENITIDMYL